MNLRPCLVFLLSIALVSISGCKSTNSLSNRRVPVVNQEYLDGKKDKKEYPVIKSGEDNYYGFNSHHMAVNYFEEKPSKEIFHAPPKKIKKKKAIKIYRKIPKKPLQEQHHTEIKQKKIVEKNIVKVKPKASVGLKKKEESKKENKKNVVGALKPLSKKQKNTASLIDKGHDKPKYDPVYWPDDKDSISKLDIEKDVAYLKQDLIKKDQDVLAKLKPKNTKSRSDINAQSNGKLSTYDVESKPIPLPFK